VTIEQKMNVALIALLAFWLALWAAGCGTTSVTKVEVRERIDTLLVKGDTVRVVDVQSDTIFVEEIANHNGQAPIGFRSVRVALDTTVQGVRMYLQYTYPPDRWSANIIQRDTVIKWTGRDSIVERPYEVEHVPFWVYIALGCMALALLALLLRR
jgi:hypothetical protein